jgi:hypothetical protein
MPMLVHANITALLDALAARDEDTVIRETLTLLGPEKVPPAKIAARVGIPAAWGGGDGHALSVLAVAGRVAEWMRAIPLGPEPEAEGRRQLGPALPLAQGLLAVADRVQTGLPEPHPTLPQGIPPADVKHPDGPLGALREALAAKDLERTRAILMGYYATGVDYRALLTLLYAALAHRYPESGHPLTFVVSGSRVLDMADWGDRVPAYIYWLTPLILTDTPDTTAGQAARDYAADAAHDLGWLRQRLSIPKEEAAGPAFQQALVAGVARAACDAVLQALRGGATPMGVAAGMALAAAERINGVVPGDRQGLLRAGHVLLYVNAVHTATTQTQNPEIWPLLYTAACAVNAAQTPAAGLAPESGARAAASVPVGGLIAATMLRNFEQQLADGDTASALTLARRYLQMGHPARALAGVIGAVGATRDAAGAGDAAHTLPLVAAAAEEYMNLPQALQGGGQNALLTAAVRLAAELTSGHALADRVRAAINVRL